jgi:hypothetical protein
MVVVGAIALLLLAGAVVVLYAMMGELASRLPDPAEADLVKPLEDYIQGATVADWPTGLSDLANDTRALIVVLSPICDTCAKVAAELSTYEAHPAQSRIGVVVSAATLHSGEDFVERHSLSRFPHIVDEGGQWITGNFGVKMSPSALLMERGALVDAYTFTKMPAIVAQMTKAKEGMS